MIRILLALSILLASCSAAAAQAVSYDASGLADGTYLIKVQNGKIVSCDGHIMVRLDATLPAPIDPLDPIDPPPVVQAFAEIVKAATEAVPQYADRDKHAKALGFAADWLAPKVGRSDQPVAEGVELLHQFLLQVCEGNEAHWSEWWGTVEAGLLTSANTKALASNLKTVADGISAALPDGAGEPADGLDGARGFGLGLAFLRELLEILRPLLIAWLTGVLS